MQTYGCCKQIMDNENWCSTSYSISVKFCTDILKKLTLYQNVKNVIHDWISEPSPLKGVALFTDVNRLAQHGANDSHFLLDWEPPPCFLNQCRLSIWCFVWVIKITDGSLDELFSFFSKRLWMAPSPSLDRHRAKAARTVESVDVSHRMRC